MKKRSPGLAKAIMAAGGLRRLAALLEIQPPAVNQWIEIPARRIIDVERVTGVPREELRPDLYR
jgi:DNA-binding transcriptional regulator YdaS (Cro superfamily)